MNQLLASLKQQTTGVRQNGSATSLGRGGAKKERRGGKRRRAAAPAREVGPMPTHATGDGGLWPGQPRPWPPARQSCCSYDGAIRRIKEARQAIEAAAVNERFVAIEQGGRDHRRRCRAVSTTSAAARSRATSTGLYTYFQPAAAAGQSGATPPDLRRAGPAARASCAPPGAGSRPAQPGVAGPPVPTARPERRAPRSRSDCAGSPQPPSGPSTAILRLTAGCSYGALLISGFNKSSRPPARPPAPPSLGRP